MVKNVVFFLAWLGVLLLSMFGIVYVVSPDYFVSFTISNTLILSISILYFIITLFRFLTLFVKKDGYAISSSFGDVLVSTDSIKSIIKETLEHDNEIKNLKIICGRKNKKYRITLFMELYTKKNIADKSSQIQQLIKDELFSRLELEIDIVEIKISKVSIKPQVSNNEV